MGVAGDAQRERSALLRRKHQPRDQRRHLLLHRRDGVRLTKGCVSRVGSVTPAPGSVGDRQTSQGGNDAQQTGAQQRGHHAAAQS